MRGYYFVWTVSVALALLTSVGGCGDPERRDVEAESARKVVLQSRANMVDELRTRWNAAQARNGKQDGYDWTWAAGEFPHPSYRKGTGEEYHSYTKHLIAMFGGEEGQRDFDYVAENKLWDVDLVHVTGGQAAVAPKETPDGRREVAGFTYSSHTLAGVIEHAAKRNSYGLTAETRDGARALRSRVAGTRSTWEWIGLRR